MSADAVVLAFLHLAGPTPAGLSYGDPATHDEFVARLAPFDTPADAEDLCGGQSCCTTATCAALLIADVDGTVTGFRNERVCDPLREPRAGRYDSPAYLETLARQRGLLRRPKASERPDIKAGCVLMLGPEVHGIMVTSDMDADGRFDSTEGGKVDPLSKRTGAASCTRIAACRRQVRLVRGVWRCFYEDGSDGRAVLFWFQAGDLPAVGDR